MTNANAETARLAVQDATQRLIFEKQLRDAIAKRKGKTPTVPQDKEDKFVKDSIKLRFEPNWKMAGAILARIMTEGLYLLSDGDREQYEARLRLQPEDGVGEQSADTNGGSQSDRRIEAAAASGPGHPSAVDGGASPEAQEPDVQPASAVAASTSTGAKAGALLTSAEVQHPGSTATIEIMHGKHCGVHPIFPVTALYPRIIGQARDDMKKSLSQHGQKEDVVALGNSILDGLNRIDLMNELGLAPVVVQFSSLNTGLTPGEWVMIKNYDRRNLTDDQRLAIAAGYQALVKAGSTGEHKPHDEAEAGAGTQSDEAATGAESETSEYRQKPAENTPPKKRGRPRGKRSDARAVAARTGQTRYRAEAMIKLRDQAPDLAEAVHRGELKLKQAMAKLKERQKSQAGAAPVAKPQRTPDEQRVKDATSAGLQALHEIMRKKQVRTWERVPFWRGIADLARREAAMYA